MYIISIILIKNRPFPAPFPNQKNDGKRSALLQLTHKNIALYLQPRIILIDYYEINSVRQYRLCFEKTGTIQIEMISKNVCCAEVKGVSIQHSLRRHFKKKNVNASLNMVD